jgi:octaprenyl-diphosphate synthase
LPEDKKFAQGINWLKLPSFLCMQFVTNVIGEELKTFEKRFETAVKSNTALLDRIMKFIIKRKGKQMRPMFVLLSAKLHGSINESTYRAAALVELLHNAIWKNKIAVLVGDYLLSKGLLLSTGNNDFEHLHILSDAVQQMSEGELLQIEKSRKLNLDEKIYFEIIKNKTASLLSSACAVGAYSTTKDKTITDKMKLFGEKAGIAFQIKDDLFDYGKEDIGKPTGNDIKEKKLTLPLIYTLNKIDAAKRRELIYIIKNENKNKEKVKQVIDTVVQCGGITYATEKMNRYRDEALEILYEFEDNPVRHALEALVRYTTDRKY